MYPVNLSRAALAVAGLFAYTTSAAFNAASNQNSVVYWGQGDSQMPLSEVCSDPSADIVVLGFINHFPTKVGDYPGSDFGNACWADVYIQPDGKPSKLYSMCPSIEQGINTCHANGKKVLLSIGGGRPTDYYLANADVAVYLAEFLWGAFGPKTDAWGNKPRPFGSAAVDGFDLDLEAHMSPEPFPTYKWANYARFVNHLTTNLFPKGPLPKYYISGAPQCLSPDERLADAIKNSNFDFIFTQFYNTNGCSARDGYNGLNKGSTTFTFDAWVAWLNANSKNKGVKLYLGLPAGVAGAGAAYPHHYLTPTEANALVSFYQRKHSSIFGGVMLWEATVSERNKKCGKGYMTWIKEILSGKWTGKTFTEVCPPTSSSTLASSTIRTTSSKVSSTRSSMITSTATLKSSSTVSSSSSIKSSSSSSIKPSSSSSPTPSSTSSTVKPSSSSLSSTVKPSSSSSSSSSSLSSSVKPSSSLSSTATPSLSSSSSASTYVSSSTLPTTISSSASSTAESTSSSASSTPVTSSSSSKLPPFPTGSNSTMTHPTGGISTGISSTESSSVVPSTTDGSSVAPPSTTEGSSVVPPSTTDGTSVVPSTTDGTSIIPSSTDSSATVPVSTGASSSVSSTEIPVSTSCSTSSTGAPYPASSSSASIPGYPVSSSSSSSKEYVPSSTSGYEGYPTGPSITDKPEQPPSYPTTTTTVITTTYVDICPTGLTTVTATITKTVCPVCPTAKPTPGEVPEGWTTTVTVCTHCGPATTTVTLTKPVDYPTKVPEAPGADYPAASQPPSEHPGASKPAPEYPAASQPAPEYPVASPPADYPVDTKETQAAPVAYPTGPAAPELPEETATSTIVKVITLTKVPVPTKDAHAPPYGAANSTAVYPTGTASSTGSAPYKTYTPAPFTGAASRVGVGMSVVAAMVAGILAL